MDKKLLLLIIIGFISFLFFNQKNEKLIPENNLKTVVNPKIEELIEFANSYKGVLYRAGGSTRKGMDCSGLVSTSFKRIGIKLPRSSSEISKNGKDVFLEDVKIGDLLFFNIARLQGEINHVGLVTLIKNGEIFFIHSTTSNGVIVSSMKQIYWKNEFVIAKRIL
ncbi:C40 family peptidase [Tenacibaculum ovolyticum]|uniref:C40 family peptidase n=1 Tax=Tenacibaculum ovolyticum TaxID=104270 RepID=UPI001F3CB681|nr:C40 family peptidase [Tenacibaculum ovolyticum]